MDTAYTQPLLVIDDLRVTFRTDRGHLPALRGVNLALEAGGRHIGVVGESGSGKSAMGFSILRLHNTLHTTYGGKILFKGKDVLSFSERELSAYRGKEVGIIFQEPMSALNPVMKVGAQVAEPLLVHGECSEREAMARVEDRLEAVGIVGAKKRMEAYPHQLSGGMRQRVVIALATILHPPLLIADEPTTSLDVTVQRQVLELLKRIGNEYRVSIMLISHDLGIIADIAEVIAVMYLGEVVEYGTREEILASPKHPYTEALLSVATGFEREDATQNARLKTIQGSVPSPLSLPKGCAFHPRCEKCMDVCKTTAPPRILEGERSVLCHLYA